MISDPQKERAVIGCIVAETWAIPWESHIDPQAFTEPICRIVYSAAIRVDKSGNRVCEVSVNDFILKHGLDKELQLEVDRSKTISWTKWTEHADKSQAYSPLSIQESLAGIQRCYIESQTKNLKRQLFEETIDHAEYAEKWEHLHGPNGDIPAIQDSFDLCEEDDDTPPEIVSGVFHQGSKVMIAGGSKAFKTWQLIQLAVCVSAGHIWLKFDTSKGRVLYVNFELPKWSMRKRIKEVRNALEIKAEKGSLHVLNLRGYATAAEKILPKVIAAAKKHHYVLIVLDPLYKLLGERDENSATDMAHLMNQVENITTQTHSATAFGSHFSKGNQAAKNAIDRMSGSGVLARDPDTLIICTEHVKEDAFSVSMILRNLPKQPNFVMSFRPPLMLMEDELDPEELRQPNKPTGRPNAGDQRETQIKAALSASRGLTVAQLGAVTGIKDTTLRHDLRKMDGVFYSEVDFKWAIKC